MGLCEPLFLQMQPNLVPHLKLMQNSVLVVSLPVFGIGFFQNFMDLLLDVLNPFKKSSGLVNLGLHISRFLLCLGNMKSYINWGQWLEPQGNLQRDVASRDVKGSVVVVLKIWETLIPCMGTLQIVHS